MNTNKFLVGGIVGGIVSFALGYLLYDLLFKTYFDTNVYPFDMATVKLWAWIASNLLYGFLFAYILGKANVSSLAKGATVGFVAGLLLEASLDLGFYSAGQLYKSLTAICADVALTAVISAVVGAAIVWANGMGKKVA